MKRWFKIILVISLLLNCCIALIQYLDWKRRKENAELNKPFDVETVNIKDEQEKLIAKIKRTEMNLSDKEYLFITMWDTGNFDSMKQLSKIDSVVEPLRKDVAYISLCEGKADYASRMLNRYNIKTKNFIHVHQADSFIYAVLGEKNIKFRWGLSEKLPMNLIMDRAGKILYFDSAYVISGAVKDSSLDRNYVLSLKNALNNLN